MSDIETVVAEQAAKVVAQSIPTALVRSSPYQPRTHFDDTALQSLASTIADGGLDNPILVRRVNEEYELVDGERRLMACRDKLKWHMIDAKVIECSDRVAMRKCGIGNAQKEDLLPSEQARQVHIFFTYGMSIEEITQDLGPRYSHNKVRELLKVAELPQQAQDMLDRKEISRGLVSVLAGIAGAGAERQIQVAEMARDEDLNTNEVMARTQHLRPVRPPATSLPKTVTQKVLSPGELSRKLLLLQRELVDLQCPTAQSPPAATLLMQVGNTINALQTVKTQLAALYPETQ